MKDQVQFGPGSQEGQGAVLSSSPNRTPSKYL
jgi:hypothetical protein